MKNKTTKPRTRWYHTDFGPNGSTWIKVGVVNNPKSAVGYTHDCVRLQVRSDHGTPETTIDHYIRLDEAASLSTGLTKCLERLLTKNNKHLQNFARAVKEKKL